MEISLQFLCYRVTPGLCRPTSVTRPGRAVAYRDAAGHTVVLPGLHQECTVANRSIIGTEKMWKCDLITVLTSSNLIVKVSASCIQYNSVHGHSLRKISLQRKPVDDEHIGFKLCLN